VFAKHARELSAPANALSVATRVNRLGMDPRLFPSGAELAAPARQETRSRSTDAQSHRRSVNHHRAVVNEFQVRRAGLVAATASGIVPP
jgi:hypothetical protein